MMLVRRLLIATVVLGAIIPIASEFVNAANAVNAQPGDAAPPTHSDQQTAATTDGSIGPDVLKEVVVRAQLQKEPLQTTPVAIAVFSAQDLLSAQALQSSDLPMIVPGVQLTRAGESESTYIRGVGDSGAVLRYIDGVLMVYGSYPVLFNNLASVEIDKGPQSTLFGRNATGGVIQFITKTPSRTPSADVSLGYGNYNTWTVNAYGTTGLGDHAATDLAVYFNDQLDGWGTNFATGQPVYKEKDINIRSKTVVELTDTATATFSAQYYYAKNDVGSTISPAVGVPFIYNEITGTKFTIPGELNLDSYYQPRAYTKGVVAAVTLEDNFGWARGISITSYQRNDGLLDIDYTGTPIDFLHVVRLDYDHAWTQELRLSSEADSRIQWVVGGFYLENSSTTDPFQFGGPAATLFFGAQTGVPYNIVATDVDTTYAGFGQLTIPMIWDTKLTLGARYTTDRTSVTGHTALGDTGIPGTAGGGHLSSSEPTYRAGLERKLASNIFGYVSYNRGYNAGGFNPVSAGGYAAAAIPGLIIKPEFMNAYEAGIKTQWLHHRLRANVSAFLYDYTNLQFPVFQASTSGAAIATAPAARVKGVDFDFAATMAKGLTLSGGFEVLDSRFSQYAGGPVFTLAPNGALTQTVGNDTGNYTVSAPNFGASLIAQYVRQSSIGEFTTNAAWSYDGRWYAEASNHFYEPAHQLVNLSETWTAPNQRTKVSLWAKNVGNVRWDAGINLLAPTGVLSEPGAPRTYGITVSEHF